uniref:Uncharacterized protein n=1 Tax=Thermorudis sp. TaxID=1969470 RepID=A0A7C2WDV9_9BACT
MGEQGLGAGAVVAAVVALRREHPEARIAAELVTAVGEQAIVRVTVELPGHGSASALGSAEAGESPRWVELAEDRALLRALSLLGYQAAASWVAGPSAEPEAPALSAPSDRPSGWDQAIERPEPVRREAQVARPAEPVGVGRSPGKGDGAGHTPPETGLAGGIARERGAPLAPSTQTARPAAGQEEASWRESKEPRSASRSDYGWDEFWRWARAQGFFRKEQIAEALGRPVEDLTPRELRMALEAYLREHEQRP